MLPPDEYVIRLLDRLVLWLHNWGIERKITIRAAASLAVITLIPAHFAQAGDIISGSIASGLLTVMVLIVTGAEEWRAGSTSKDVINAAKLWVRSLPIAWFRCALIVGAIILPETLHYGWLAFDAYFWALWLYAIETVTPPEKPKRHWRELLEPKLSPETA